MKKILSLTAIFFGIILAFAQAPDKMSYQAIIRNASGQLLQNQNVALKVSILQGSTSGTVVYSERLTGTTNSSGSLAMEIGNGTVLSGTFSGINWSSGNYYLKTETDPTGGTNYTIAGTSQLLSVPYAMYAKAAGSGGTSQWTTSGNNIYNSNTGNVGIGTNNPSSKFTVKADYDGITQESQNGNVKVGLYADYTFAYLQTITNTDLNFATNSSSMQMTLQKGTGNLGIGNANPSEKLDVNGKTKTTNLQITNGAGTGKILASDASGNASWTQLVRNDVLMVTPLEFSSTDNNQKSSILLTYFPTNVTGGVLNAPVHLPNGAIITEIKVYFIDTGNGNDYQLGFARLSPGNPFPVTLASTNTSGADTAIRNFNLTIPTPITIDNANNFYYLGMSGNFIAGDGIAGVKITYSYPVNN